MHSRHLILRFVASALVLAFAACADDDSPLPAAPGGPNRPPVIEVMPDTTVILADTLRLSAAASDPDGDRLTYALTVLLRDASEVDYVAQAHIDPATGELWFVPGWRDRPNRAFLITVVDEAGYPASTQFNVDVSYYVDQSSTPYTSLAQNVISYAPMGQEFVPAFSALDVVELRLNGAHSGPGDLVVKIRGGTIAGPVLAVSDTLTLAGDFDGVALFQFERVALTPQQLYVLEIVLVSGRNFLAGSGGNGSTYPFGRQILDGQPQENNDLWFREGAIAPAPPEVPLAPSALKRGPT